MRRPLLSVLAVVFGAAAAAGAMARPDAGPSAPVREEITISFAPSAMDMPNPERGFYHPAPATLDRLTRRDLAPFFARGTRLVLARIDLAPYRDRALPAEFLDDLDRGAAAARAAGVKLIVRAAYNYPAGETDYQNARDAALPQVLAHLRQLTPMFTRNADVIAFVQAGLIGAWGEWHTSSHHLTEPEPRTRIKQALLEAVPATRFVQFRYPPYLEEWTPRLPGLASALAGDFRTGFHNDCFLASRTDVGTFVEDANGRAAQQRYLDELGDLAPFGGETCNPRDEAGATPRTECADILREGARYNLTYLNDAYYRRAFHDNWRRQGCLDEVSSRMGYRLRLVAASYPRSAAPGETMTVAIVVRNEGWARLYNPRAAQLLLRDAHSGRVMRIDATGVDPRRWLPGADSHAAFTVVLPRGTAPGRYDVLLALPDAAEALKADPRYAIRFANADVAGRGQYWDTDLGAFAIGGAVEIR